MARQEVGERIAVRLPAEMQQALTAEAERTGYKQAQIVRIALAKHLKLKHSEKLPQKFVDKQKIK